MGTLYVVATPIGNLSDISPRAVQILRDVALIAAEDTRHTGGLLSHFGIKTPMISYHAFNEQSRRGKLLDAIAVGDVALVADAGTPAISDPGAELVDAVLEAGFPVRTVPGPSALTAAASISGLLDGPFTFLGFLPRKAGERRAVIARAAAASFGVVLFESPNRLQSTLRELETVFEGRRFAVARELSKLHESLVRGVLHPGEAYSAYEKVRGEVVVVIAASTDEPPDSDAEEVLARLLESGMRASAAARSAAELTGRPRSELYAIAVELDRRRQKGQGDAST